MPEQAPRAASESSSPAVVVSGFVVLSGGTRLHARPEARSNFVELPAASSSDPLHRKFAAFEVVDGTGAWIKVRSLPPEDRAGHCVVGLATLSGSTLTAWVRRDKLVPVLQRPSTQTDAAHATMRFAPGLPVDDDNGTVPALSPTREPLAVDPESIGLSYQPSTYESPVIRVRSPLDTPLKFDGAEIHSNRLRGAGIRIQDKGRRVFTQGPAVYAIEQRNGTRWITVGTRCIRLEVADSATLYDDATLKPGATLGRFGPEPDDAPRLLAVPPGATVYWQDGTVAGTAHQSLSVRKPLERRGNVVCAQVGWSLSAPRFCFDPQVFDPQVFDPNSTSSWAPALVP